MRTLEMLAAAAGMALIFGCEKADETAKHIAPATTDFGTGVNNVEKTYARTAPALYDVVAAALRSFELKIESDRHDDLGGEIDAVRADGNKVTVKITSVDQTHTQVSIRVAPGNRNLAELIHERIAEKLSGQSVKEEGTPSSATR